MKNFKERFKKDFVSSQRVDLPFDLDLLEPNTPKSKHKANLKPLKVGLAVSLASLLVALAVPVSVFLVSAIRVKSSVKLDQRHYSLNQIKMAESNTFKKLNEVNYPALSSPQTSYIEEKEKEAYANFANCTYRSLIQCEKKENMSYSIASLYAVMNELSGALSSEEAKAKFESLLGLDEYSRSFFYAKMMKANSFASESSTIQIKNAAFFHSDYRCNQDYIKSLSSLYCEAYQLDFASEAEKIVSWANQAVNANGFIDKNFLEMDEDTILYLFSTLYFKNMWQYKYLNSNNTIDDFYLDDGSVIKTEYMSHSYQSDGYYDYGSYIAFSDYYAFGNAKVTYFVPKKVEDDIFALTKDKNLFEVGEGKFVKASGNSPYININLKTPKFSQKVEIDFKDCLVNIGLGSIFDPTIDSFKKAFDDEKLKDVNTYLQKIKQKNEVEFNEDGSTIKSITMASLGAGSAGPMGNDLDTLDVELNQPFIYVIEDKNDIPIFLGHVNRPKA